MTEVITSFGLWLRRRRKALDLTQDDLASAVGCSKELIAKVEQDARRPSKQVAELLARALQIDAADQALFVRAARAELATDQLPSPIAGVPQPRLSVPAIGLAPPQAIVSEPPPRHTNLPAPQNTLIGRTHETAAVIALLGTARLVTLTGPGGTGKTRLALQIGTERLDQYVDGVWFVDLSPVSDPDQIASTIALVLGVPESPTRPIADGVREWLRGRKVLLILDNCEQIIAGVAGIATDLLRSTPQLQILTTSRIPLRIAAEQEYAVEPLGIPDPATLPPLDQLSQYDAVALFIARARAVRATFTITIANAPAVAEICARLDGLPLAIELAAARVRLFPPDQLLARLVSARMQTLAGGARDLPARQQTIRAAIDWSYRLLSTSQQTLLARLGVFVGGWTLEAAEAVCSDDQLDVIDGMTALVEHSLVRLSDHHGVIRYGMLETIRTYALERLAELGEDQPLRERHASYFVQLVEACDAQRALGRSNWQDLVSIEAANIDSVLSWACVVTNDQRSGIRIAQALEQYWLQTAQMRRALQYTSALVHAYTDRATLDYIRLLGLQGSQHFKLREHRQALTIYTTTFPWLVTHGYAMDACKHIGTASRCARNLGDLDLAHALAVQEQTVIDTYQLEPERRSNIMLFGDIATDQGNFAQAIAYYDEGLARSQTANDINAMGVAYLARGRTWRAAKQYSQALADFDAALRIHATTEPYFAHIELLEMCGILYEQKRYQELIARIRILFSVPSYTSGDDLFDILYLVGYLNVDQNPCRATLLLSLAAALEQRMEAEIGPLPTAEQQIYTQQTTLLRGQIGDSTFESIWAVGQTLSWKQAMQEVNAWLAEQEP